VCHVSAVSRGHSPGNCFPQLGPKFFVITGQAATSHYRSPPILIGWRSALRNDYKKSRSPLAELANSTNSLKSSTKRRIIVRAQTASPRIFGAFTLLSNGNLPCCSKPVRWRCRVFFTKDWMRRKIPEEPAHWASPHFLPPDGNPMGSLEIWMHHPPREIRMNEQKR
jgi:hypothetical protein